MNGQCTVDNKFIMFWKERNGAGNELFSLSQKQEREVQIVSQEGEDIQKCTSPYVVTRKLL